MSIALVLLVMVSFSWVTYARAEGSETAGSDDKIVTGVTASHEDSHESKKVSHKVVKHVKAKKKSKKHTTTTTIGTVSTPATAVVPTTATTYTMAQVATANSAAKCWTVISGKVYNLTSWIAQHPGGEGAILSICGKDGTAAFNNQHGGQGKPEQILSTFLIGTLN